MDVYWLEQTEADLPEQNDWLCPSEALRLDSFRFPKRRSDWRLGRWTAKRALAGYLKVPADAQALAAIEIRAAASGAPEAVLANQPAAVTISLSHRAGRAICAVSESGAALGCDLEIVEQRSHAFMADYFTTEEQAMAARAPAAERSRLLNLLWSAKESGLKALLTGLRLDPRDLTVSLVDTPGHGVWHPLRVRCAGAQTFYGWWQQTDNQLRTLVAAPPPAKPILLEVPTYECVSG